MIDNVLVKIVVFGHGFSDKWGFAGRGMLNQTA
jgi:hypothetical protein